MSPLGSSGLTYDEEAEEGSPDEFLDESPIDS